MDSLGSSPSQYLILLVAMALVSLRPNPHPRKANLVLTCFQAAPTHPCVSQHLEFQTPPLTLRRSHMPRILSTPNVAWDPLNCCYAHPRFPERGVSLHWGAASAILMCSLHLLPPPLHDTGIFSTGPHLPRPLSEVPSLQLSNPAFITQIWPPPHPSFSDSIAGQGPDCWPLNRHTSDTLDPLLTNFYATLLSGLGV